MKYIVLSFDDGAKDFYNRALDILKKYNLTAVLNIISDKANKNNNKFISWEEISECKMHGIEIANHSANHTNEVEDIIHGAKDIQTHLGVTEKIGFASPNSEVCEKNLDVYKDLLRSGQVLYIRSGNQLKRDGYFHAFLYLVYKYTSWKKIFYWYNKRNVIELNKPNENIIFPSVTCNNDNTMLQIIHLIEKMPDNSACIIMLHQIFSKEDEGYKTVKWSNTIEDFEFLCSYLSKSEKISVINHKKLYELTKNNIN